MAKIKFVLDKQERKDGTNIVMLSFIHKGFRKQATLGIKVHPENWYEDECLVSAAEKNQRHINQRLQFFRSAAEGVLLRHYGLHSDGATIYADLEAALFPDKAIKRVEQEAAAAEQEAAANTLIEVFKRFTALKKPSTRLTYERTLKHVEAFIAEDHSNVLDELNKAWLTEFDIYLSATNPSANARALHMRNLRAVLNYALDEELTTNYPFRRFKIKTVKTAKRSLSVDTLHDILTYEVEDWQEIYRDMFALSFMLMGINFADMLYLKPSQYREGRIEFNRAKTARLYSMKVEPEAARILEKYAGQDYVLRIMEGRKEHLQFIRQTNNALRKIGVCERHGLGGKKTHHAICPDLSTYWARHTWATIAAELDIPKETIAAALGHGGNTVTDIYINFNTKKIDEANRRVLDYVLYGKDYRVPEVAVEPKKKVGRPRKSA